MTLDLTLTDEEAEALLKELDNIIDSDRFPFSPRIRLLKATRAKIQPEPGREPLPPPPKQYAAPRSTAAKRRRGGR
jgi:DNA replication initiation complex subunit (GINS family)